MEVLKITLMKRFSVFLFVTGFSLLNSQNKIECKIDHKCTTTVSVDDFENSKTYSTGFRKKILKKLPKLSYDISKHNFKGNLYTMLTFIQQYEGCRTKKSYVQIMFNDNSIIKLLPPTDSIDCGTGILTVNATDYMEVLLNKDIKKIRVYTDLIQDYEPKDKYIKGFKNDLLCISNLE